MPRVDGQVSATATTGLAGSEDPGAEDPGSAVPNDARTGPADESGLPRLGRRQVGRSERGRLVFAQVREDSAIDVAAVDAATRRHVVVITSGGGTALSMLAAGAARVTAVDANRSQNDMAELQAVAVAHLGSHVAVGYLGGWPMPADERLRIHDCTIRPRLSGHSRMCWDRRRRDVARGALQSGVTEHFLDLLVQVMRRGVVPSGAIEALLACQGIDEQRRVMGTAWDSARWRGFFRLLANRRVCTRVYRPEFFAHVAGGDFATYFRNVVESGLTATPIADNYFAHLLLEGRFRPECLPPHLTAEAATTIGGRLAGLELVDGDVFTYLASQPDQSVDAVCLSNICEWLPPEHIESLLREVVRVATDDAALVLRNFVGWTEIPPSLRDLVVVDAEYSDRVSRIDRSLLQQRVIVAQVNPSGRAQARRALPEHAAAMIDACEYQVRGAVRHDNPALAELIRNNPIETHVSYYVDRSPDYLALPDRFPGSHVFVVDDPAVPGRLAGTVTLLRREMRVGGSIRPVLYLGGLNRRPSAPQHVMRLLEGRVAELVGTSDADVVLWIVNDTNARARQWESRLSGRTGMEVQSWAKVDYTEEFPMRRRQVRLPAGAMLSHATDEDLDQVAALINDHYRHHLFFTPLTADAIRGWPDIFPGFCLADIHVLRGRFGELRAVGITYDPAPLVNVYPVRLDRLAKMSQVVIGAVHRATRLLPDPPHEGAAIRTRHLRHLGYRTPADATAIVDTISNRLLDEGKQSLSYVLDSRDRVPSRTTFVFRYPAAISGHANEAAASALSGAADAPVFFDVTLT